MFYYFVASAKLLLLFLVIFLCSPFTPIIVFFLFLSAVVAGDVTAADVAVIAAGAAVGPDGTAAAAVAAVGPDALCVARTRMNVNLCLLMDGGGFANNVG